MSADARGSGKDVRDINIYYCCKIQVEYIYGSQVLQELQLFAHIQAPLRLRYPSTAVSGPLIIEILPHPGTSTSTIPKYRSFEIALIPRARVNVSGVARPLISLNPQQKMAANHQMPAPIRNHQMRIIVVKIGIIPMAVVKIETTLRRKTKTPTMVVEIQN
jgi:hypothetical protein